jgi:hypothetical protein
LYNGADTQGSVFVGYRAGLSVTSGVNNTYIGAASGLLAVSSYNTGVGYQAAQGASGGTATGDYNTAIGGAALNAFTSGERNTAVGVAALGNNSSGTLNTAVGMYALASNLSASTNTAVGYQAGYFYSGTNGYNTLFGYQAGYSMGGGIGNYANVMIGHRAGYLLNGNTYQNLYNCFVGSFSGSEMTTGGKNTILGSYSGNQDNLDLRSLSNRTVLSDGDGNVTYYNSSVSTYLLSSKTLVVKENYADESINANTQITGVKSANASGVATAIYYCGHTNAHNLRIIARQNTANVGSWVGSVTVAYGTPSIGNITTTTQGTMGTIAVAYNNGGSPAYQIEVTLTYTGSAPSIYWFADGIFGENEPYAI